MKIPFYWCKINNFGDALNPLILSKLGSIQTYYKQDIKQAELIGIGSILENLLIDNPKHNFIKRPIRIFSSGLGFPEGEFFHNPNIILPEQLQRNIICYALRGKYTKARMEKMKKSSLNECALGDAGLLASFLINKQEIKPIYDLGIIPHLSDMANPIFDKVLSEVPNSILIDPQTEPIEFLKSLCLCKTVISTAMHPLIACDALRIPNLWIRVHTSAATEYKFYDYYSVFNLKPVPFYIEADIPTPEYIIQNYQITDEQVYNTQQNLLKALQKLHQDIKRDTIKIICYKILYKIISNVIKDKEKREYIKAKIYLG